MKLVAIVFLFLFLFAGCVPNEITPTITLLNDKKVIAYVNKWEDNWGDDYQKVKQITHINYAFADIKDGKVVELNDYDTETIKKINNLKKINKNLKVLISVGGWTHSKNFSDAALTEESREIFANSAIAYMQKHKIDGIDLDWEYPGLLGDNNVFRPEDKENFTAILKLLRSKLDALASSQKNYLLTIATGASQNYLDHTNMSEAQKYLDFVNIMTYDFLGGGNKKTGHHANLTTSESDDNESVRSAIIAVDQHIKAGIPVDKIVLGVPFYGRWWSGVNAEHNGLGQDVNGLSNTYNYNEIVDSLNSNVGFIEYWDEPSKAPYIWRLKDSLFISYENEKSIKYKADYVIKKGLGGVMFWQFNGDSDGALLKAIYTNLNQNPSGL
ncbi:MAG: glycoside hydrolase family 18 protein [Saprospiraceae bacterium]